jgi:hypothetical protein
MRSCRSGRTIEVEKKMLIRMATISEAMKMRITRRRTT